MFRRRILCAVLFVALAAPAGAGPKAAETAAGRPAIGEETERQKLTLRRAVAEGLRNEAYGLQQRGQIRDAVIRYRQSLAYWPDTGLESYLTPLERQAGFAALQYNPQAGQADTGSAVPGPARVYATVRNRSARDITFAVRGEAPEAATTVRAGEIRIRPVSLGPGGEVTFEVSCDGQLLETRGWKGNPNSSSVVPALLYDDTLKGRLFVMTGLR